MTRILFYFMLAILPTAALSSLAQERENPVHEQRRERAEENREIYGADVFHARPVPPAPGTPSDEADRRLAALLRKYDTNADGLISSIEMARAEIDGVDNELKGLMARKGLDWGVYPNDD